jgi:magnesium-transporting ATPase (P-type)
VGAVAALRTLSRPRCTVRREGTAHGMPTTDLVPGHVLESPEGDFVGADVRLIMAHELKVDEALLTGGSLPVARDPGAIAPSRARSLTG